MTLSTTFDELADRAAVAFPEELRIQHAAQALLGGWALKNRPAISTALKAVEALNAEGAVERFARLMWIDTTDKDYWDHLDEDTKNIYRSNAVAVIAAIQERKNEV